MAGGLGGLGGLPVPRIDVGSTIVGARPVPAAPVRMTPRPPAGPGIMAMLTNPVIQQLLAQQMQEQRAPVMPLPPVIVPNVQIPQFQPTPLTALRGLLGG